MLISREKMYSGKILKVYRTKRRMPNGVTVELEEVGHPGAAIVLPYRNGKIVFIRQYRGVIDKFIWELPAGKIDPGETPRVCAMREAAEETGYEVKDLRKIGYIYTTPGFTDEKIHVYKARCVSRVKVEKDRDELIRVVELPVSRVKDMFRNGKISDAKTIAALAFAGVI
ncbi:MAG: NUDIX hydrolase [Candidatus Omnitrophica bacterium]|nr:NUDIX hydrolase [Candidatus Omnitrophota bacterium]MDD5488057.1 NUDIX hydrolase [Candidatus Omnitrophota bacterium]